MNVQQVITLMQEIGLRVMRGSGLTPEMNEDILRVEHFVRFDTFLLGLNDWINLVACLIGHRRNVEQFGLNTEEIDLGISLMQRSAADNIGFNAVTVRLAESTAANNVTAWSVEPALDPEVGFDRQFAVEVE